jgi:hypothetical protein
VLGPVPGITWIEGKPGGRWVPWVVFFPMAIALLLLVFIFETSSLAGFPSSPAITSLLIVIINLVFVGFVLGHLLTSTNARIGLCPEALYLDTGVHMFRYEWERLGWLTPRALTVTSGRGSRWGVRIVLTDEQLRAVRSYVAAMP